MNQTETQPRPIIYSRAERIWLYSLTGLLAVVLIVGLVNQLGWIIGNPTNSVSPGFYRAAAPERADHVTFCLGTRHRGARFYPRYCSPDLPGGIRILKRVSIRHADGSLTVAGDTPDAIDSRVLGTVRSEEIRGWWKPLLTTSKRTSHDD